MQRIGPSIWEFLWLISHETRMQGKVLNGAPITVSRIANELGETYKTAQRNLDRLSREGYVVRKRDTTGLQYCYTIAHSKKWRVQWEGVDKNVTPDKNVLTGQDKNVQGVRTKMSTGEDKNVHANKEDRQLDILDNKDTTCIKCSGRGIYLQRFPSKFDGHEIDQWVKCDCDVNKV